MNVLIKSQSKHIFCFQIGNKEFNYKKKKNYIVVRVYSSDAVKITYFTISSLILFRPKNVRSMEMRDVSLI